MPNEEKLSQDCTYLSAKDCLPLIEAASAHLRLTGAPFNAVVGFEHSEPHDVRDIPTFASAFATKLKRATQRRWKLLKRTAPPFDYICFHNRVAGGVVRTWVLFDVPENSAAWLDRTLRRMITGTFTHECWSAKNLRSAFERQAAQLRLMVGALDPAANFCDSDEGVHRVREVWGLGDQQRCAPLGLPQRTTTCQRLSLLNRVHLGRRNDFFSDFSGWELEEVESRRAMQMLRSIDL